MLIETIDRELARFSWFCQGTILVQDPDVVTWIYFANTAFSSSPFLVAVTNQYGYLTVAKKLIEGKAKVVFGPRQECLVAGLTRHGHASQA